MSPFFWVVPCHVEQHFCGVILIILPGGGSRTTAAVVARGVLSSFAWTLWQTRRQVKKVEKGRRVEGSVEFRWGSFPGDGTL